VLAQEKAMDEQENTLDLSYRRVFSMNIFHRIEFGLTTHMICADWAAVKVA